MGGDDEAWTRKFAPRAAKQFEDLERHVQDRLVSKLDEIVDDPWRDPGDYLEPLTGGPFTKLRVGQYRLACALSRENIVLEVHRIEHRSGAYTADDWHLFPPNCARSARAHRTPTRHGESESG